MKNTILTNINEGLTVYFEYELEEEFEGTTLDNQEISLAYTSLEDSLEEIEINVTLNLKELKLVTVVQKSNTEEIIKETVVIYNNYNEVLDLIVNMDFDSLTSPIYDFE